MSELSKKYKTIAVLGSAGQIGAPLVSYLRSKGHFVLEVDIKNQSEQEPFNSDLRLLDNEILFKRLSECDFVVFLAFDVGGSKFLKQFGKDFDFISNNVRIMENVFSFLKKESVPFIFATSSMVYSSETPYGCLKKLGEYYTKSTGGISARLWNVYGQEEVGKRSHVITDFITSAKETGKIKCLTNGKEKRQFLHVDDCCDAFYAIMENYDSLKRRIEQESTKLVSVDVSSFKWTTIKKLTKMVAKQTNSSFSLSEKSDHFQIKNIEPDSSLIKEYWSPRISLKEGIKRIKENISQ
jgi:nucleoside-diphosphate-sugar epimerase